MPDRAATLATVRDKYPMYRGMSDEALGTALADKYPDAYGFLRSAPAATAKPRTLSGNPLRDVAAIAAGDAPLGWLDEPAETDPRGGQPGRTVRAVGDLFLPKTRPDATRLWATLPIGGSALTAPIKRTFAGGLAGAGTALAQGQDLATSGLEGVSQAASQFAGELLPGVARFGMTQRAAKPLLAAREAKIAHDVAMDKALTATEGARYTEDVAARRTAEAARVREARARHQERNRDIMRAHTAAEQARKSAHESAVAAAKAKHEQDTRAYAENGARVIADSFKAKSPAFREFPSTEAGLLDMVYGKGPQNLSARYDAALADVVTIGRGRMVEIPVEDAKFYGLKRGKIVQDRVSRDRDMASVDAGALAQKMTGSWTQNHGAYRRAARALDAADIGDPVARGEYRDGQALIQFTDTSKMLKGHKFNPAAARDAFTSLKKVDQLRKRGAGDIFRGPIAEAVSRPAPELRLPPEPAALSRPALPVFRRGVPLPEVPKPTQRVILDEPMPKGVTTRTLPKMTFWEGAALAEIPFLIQRLVTGTGAGGYGIPFAVGGLGAHALSGRRFATEAPLSTASRFATDMLPQPIAQETRRLVE